MSLLKAAVQFIKIIFAKLWQLIVAALGLIFGSMCYQAPSWIKWCGSKLAMTTTTIQPRFSISHYPNGSH